MQDTAQLQTVSLRHHDDEASHAPLSTAGTQVSGSYTLRCLEAVAEQTSRRHITGRQHIIMVMVVSADD